MLADIWLEFRNADKAIRIVLYFIKPCKLKESFFFFFLLLEQSITKYRDNHHFKNFQLLCQQRI